MSRSLKPEMPIVCGTAIDGAVAFEQHAERDVVIVAEDAVERRHLGERVAEEIAAERHAGRHRRRRHQPRIEQAGRLHGRAVAGKPALRARVHARAEEADTPVADLDHVVGGGAAALEMREADHHVDRIGSGLHDLHDRAAGGLQQLARRGRLVDARHDQRRRPLAEEDLQQPLLLKPGIMRIAELDAEGAVRQAVVDAAHHLGEDVVGQRRHQHAEHFRARRGERPGVRVRHIAEFVHRLLDLLAQALRNAFRLAQRARHGDRADAGELCHIGNGRAAAAAACARLHLCSARQEPSQSAGGGVNQIGIEPALIFGVDFFELRRCGFFEQRKVAPPRRRNASTGSWQGSGRAGASAPGTLPPERARVRREACRPASPRRGRRPSPCRPPASPSPSTSLAVLSATRLLKPYCLVRPSMREPTLTLSPIAE